MKTFLQIIVAFIMISTFISCKKDNEINTVNNGQITLDFDPVFGKEAFDFDKQFTLENGEVVKFSQFKYFVSNIEFLKDGEVMYATPMAQSYHLIDNKKTASRKVLLTDVPVDNYTEIRFIVGIDSLMNATPATERPAALDLAGEAEGMYWSWNNGYIFLKVEGSAVQNGGETQALKYHIGGFGGYNTPTINNIKTVSISRANYAPIPVRTDKVSDVHILVDLKKMFEEPTSFSVLEHHTVMNDNYSMIVADNYKNMFRLDHVH